MNFLRNNLGWLLTIIFISTIFTGALIFDLFGQPAELQKTGDFRLRNYDGSTMYTEDFQGQPMVLNFWAAWCFSCRKEMPILEELYQKYKDQGLIVFGIHRSETESKEAGLKFTQDHNITFPLFSDRNSMIFRYYSRGSLFVPKTVFINREGFVEAIFIGLRPIENFEAMIEKIL